MDRETTILLVDDEPLVLRSMEKSLRRAGFEVETAGDVAAALSLFQEAQAAGRSFDVAILDLKMPNLEGQYDSEAGIGLLARLREMDDDLPVIVLTAFDDVGLAKKAVEQGARSYFVKGREAGLVELVNRIIAHQ